MNVLWQLLTFSPVQPGEAWPVAAGQLRGAPEGRRRQAGHQRTATHFCGSQSRMSGGRFKIATEHLQETRYGPKTADPPGTVSCLATQMLSSVFGAVRESLTFMEPNAKSLGP